ncbi:MAG: hypothetical protein WCV62_03045 [Candidatus Peribacteraceae bacterium]|jgi:hypothetical protein
MDLSVQTGIAQADGAQALLSRSLTSKSGETVLLLLQVYAEERQAKAFSDECENVIRHALLDTDGDAWSRLDGTLKELNGLMKGLLLARTMDEVHAIVAVVEKDGALHVSHAGRGEAYLVRHGAATQITEYTRGKPLSAFVHISSGALEAQDTVVVATQRLLRAFTPAQLAQMTFQRGEGALRDIAMRLEAEEEPAALALVASGSPMESKEVIPPRQGYAGPGRGRLLPSRRSGRRIPLSVPSSLHKVSSSLKRAGALAAPVVARWARTGLGKLGKTSTHVQTMREKASDFMADLKHPQRKRRAHFLLLAGALAAFLVIFLVVKLSITSQRSKTRAELSTLVDRINEEIKTADNRRIAGDTDAANDILQRADAWAKQVMDNESGLFRVQALDLLDRIRSKKEEINNITRLSPRVLVNLAAKNSDVSAQGMIGIADGEFVVFDREEWYHVLLNGVDDPRTLTEDGLIIDGVSFPRFKAQAFLTTGNSILELQGSQPVSMKTEDLSGWVTGKDMETYLRYLYILGVDNNIMKYERLNNRYGAAVQYNVSGDLTGALDMTIDSSIYVLKEGGAVVKMMRGEAKPFAITHAPDGTFKTATKIVKMSDSNFYFLDPEKRRISVTSDGGPNGESSYLRQYVLEGDQVGKLQDLYVDPDEAHLYVLDEKRIYVIDLLR